MGAVRGRDLRGVWRTGSALSAARSWGSSRQGAGDGKSRGPGAGGGQEGGGAGKRNRGGNGDRRGKMGDGSLPPK
eukprot:14337-Chlamydomonas_euryale.AAC.1